MTGIYFQAPCRLKSYSATTKSGKTVVRIEIESTDHREAGYLLNDLEKILKQQKEAARPRKEPKVAPKPLALPAPALQLTYRGDAE
ncbi:hypothetical protein [Rhizobium metallidurans]|uniref:Uncharacterized protein n=1 Tax=Rhizobium metallidurans TaxID=1265931 RepID=A0A7W6CLX0_9HYPH|nr:hypothetical protein [Rhizobium metallidurans]MBB3963512.1 hypothetical protein [Rhizobium metallidurans]